GIGWKDVPSPTMDLILASTSPYRRQLLERLGVQFRAVAPTVDEGAIQALFDSASAAELAEHLALAKAVSVSRLEPEATILGSDQVCVCDDRILNKPGTAAAAIEQLAFLSGKTHRLITAVCVWHEGATLRHRDVTTLTMLPLSREAIERYVAADSPLDCAGSYKLESRGVGLFESISSSDHTAITGLPLLAVSRLLRQVGWSIP
ncbi:MAG: Maf family protein, partial [Planctomycetaceae bacterium]|nr:Maf family protein [Planctomycetaceae bacterium]